MMRTSSIGVVTVSHLLCSGILWSAENKEAKPMQECGMVMTVSEAQVSPPNWTKLSVYQVFPRRAKVVAVAALGSHEGDRCHDEDHETAVRCHLGWVAGPL
jgi:hypothetical protein